ncbi:hypothetical protein V1525DRAFT_410763 [Lipomyces kononenkoae]|uniref:Uncharacterized protein n=1 Tax=Lipomyces kononenkoae TaxID=34357 RepID=A0ACC3SU60_LIPKO
MSAEVAPSYGLAAHNGHVGHMDGSQILSESIGSSITSVSSSMSTVTPTTRIRQLYKKARYFFINRQFPEAYSILRPLIMRSSLQDHIDAAYRNHIWRLYLALLDGIMRLPSDRLKDGFSRSEILEFNKLVQDGEIWDQIAEAYGTAINLAPDMVFMLSLLCSRHTTHPDTLRVRVENYIQQNTGSLELYAYSRVLEFYAIVILPACEMWDDASKFVLSNDLFSADKRRDMVAVIERLETKSSEARAERDAKAQLRKMRRTKPHENRPKVQKEEQKQEPQLGSLSWSSGKSENDRDEHSAPMDSSNSISDQNELIARLTRLWTFLARFCRRPDVIARLVEILVAIVVVILAFAVPDNRARLAFTMTDLWKRLRKTITMGVRVNYL